MEKTKINRDVKLGTVLVVFCLWVWFYAIPFQIKGDEQRIYPYFVTIFIAVPSLVILFRGFKAGLRTTEGETFWQVLKESAFSLISVAMMAVYAGLLDVLGYFVATAMAIIAFLLFFGVRRPLSLILTPAALLIVIYVLIERVLQFPLPDGLLF